MIRAVFGWVVTVLAVAGFAAEQDCALGERYLALSEKATEEFRQDDALQFVERAVEVCPNYENWLTLGDLAATFGEEQRNARAAEAYVAAHDAAVTQAERAAAMAKYAELLFHTNDPQNALTYVQQARNLDPENKEIATLASTITERAANVTSEDIKRGLGQMAYKPMKLQRIAEVPTTTTGGGSGIAPEKSDRRAINIPLNFEFNSTRLDQWTQKNIVVLAQTLVDPEYNERAFLLLGHTDIRGAPAHNMLLSVERANAIADEITKLQPALADRIKTDGKGEQEPLATGDTEQDHRTNRRVEVVLE